MIAFALGCGSPAPAASADAPARAPSDAAVSVGGPMPEFTVGATPSGKPLGVAKNTTTIVCLWATWSMPDVQLLAKLQEIYARNSPAGLAVLGIAIDDEESTVAKTADALGVRFPIGWDAGRRIAKRLSPPTDPTTYLIDRQGVIRAIHVGYHDGDAATLEAELKPLL
jgi:peroxiredoxin